MVNQTPTRQEEIQKIHKQYPALYSLTMGLLILLVGIYIGLHLFPTKVDDYSVNLYTEIISVIITLVILDRINEYRATQQLKRRLIREAGSQSNETAKSAIDWMRHEDWLRGENALLNFQDLTYTNLNETNLSTIEMRYAGLSYARMCKSNLWCSDLVGAELWRAELEGANLKWVDLKDAFLGGVNLKGADLQYANLEGVFLYGFTYERVPYPGYPQDYNLPPEAYQYIREKDQYRADFDEKTTLPDGTKWKPETDMRRFTDRNHPNFWSEEKDEKGNLIWWREKYS